MLWFQVKKHQGAPIHPKGQDTVDALRDWSKSEVTKAVDRSYDLGRFFFSVSAATIGALLTIAKFSSFTVDCLFWLSIGSLALSSVISIQMAIPNHWKLGGDTNLAQVHQDMVDSAQIVSFIWVSLWLAGLGLAITALFYR